MPQNYCKDHALLVETVVKVGYSGVGYFPSLSITILSCMNYEAIATCSQLLNSVARFAEADNSTMGKGSVIIQKYRYCMGILVTMVI